MTQKRLPQAREQRRNEFEEKYLCHYPHSDLTTHDAIFGPFRSENVVSNLCNTWTMDNTTKGCDLSLPRLFKMQPRAQAKTNLLVCVCVLFPNSFTLTNNAFWNQDCFHFIVSFNSSHLSLFTAVLTD